jgi:hypothetical protein
MTGLSPADGQTDAAFGVALLVIGVIGLVSVAGYVAWIFFFRGSRSDAVPLKRESSAIQLTTLMPFAHAI